MRDFATEFGLGAQSEYLQSGPKAAKGRGARTLLIAALLLIAPAQGCSDGSSRNDAANGFRGVVLEPGPRPDFTLTDTGGRPFDFRRETDGVVRLGRVDDIDEVVRD